MAKLILASASPRRKQLLEWAALDFTIMPSDVAEDFPSGLPVEEVPIFIARKKARAVHAVIAGSEQDPSVILAADTLVVLGDRIIGKPVDRDDAIAILTDLSGQTHRVITGVVIKKAADERAFSDITKVAFHPLSRADIEYYVDHHQPYDKAGAYGIQEWIGVAGIKGIAGDFYNVMGLPVSRVLKTLRQFP